MRVELGLISEDLRQRVLTAIAHELELDEAARRRSGASPHGAGATLANGAGASFATGNGVSESPVTEPPWDRDAPWPGTPARDLPAQAAAFPQGEPADRGHGAVADAVAAHEPAATAGLEDTQSAGGTADAADGLGEAADRPAVPLPRRAPGANGAPPPPAGLRREYLPPSVLGRTLDPEAHTEPLPRISGTAPGPGGPADAGSRQSTPSVFSPIPRPAAHAPAGSPSAPGAPTAAPAGMPAEAGAPSAEAAPPGTAAPGTAAPGTVPADSVPPPSVASPAAIAAAAAPTMPAGSAALAAASAAAMSAGGEAMAAAAAPTMPAGSAALAAAAGFAPPAQTGADLPPPADLAAAPTTTADQAAPVDVTAPAGQGAAPTVTSPAPSAPSPASSTSARSRPPGASVPAPSGYGWGADPGGPRPRDDQRGGSAVPLPAALPGKRPQRSGRPYRIAGVILAVVALVVAGVIALVLSGGSTPGRHSGLGPPSPGAGALVRNRAAAWVAGQVSRTVVVACDPVMCHALMTHGVTASRLYQLGPQTTSPLRSQVIVATAAVRAQFGNLLSSVYAPAVLASFGAGAEHVDVRATAQHGAAAYRAMLTSDLANRKASGAQLLHSGRIEAGVLARRELAEGEVDGRLLLAIAQMAATHPMFIVDFGKPAPGADPAIPLRQADLAEDAHARHHAGHAVSAGYVHTMVSFLRGQHGQFRPARVQSVYLPDGVAVLRIEFTAPSPLGLLGPQA